MSDTDRLIEEFSRAPTLETAPPIVNVLETAPPNPPVEVQSRTVGATGEATYRDASSFVRIARQWAERHADGLAAPVIDFGAGWGRITRFLLAHLPPASVYALDVDPAMTALTQTTLPGVQALTVQALPPTALRDNLANTLTAFSVFSHLSPAAHAAWASELGRLARPNALAFLTVLDANSPVFADVDGAQDRYQAGELVYAATGGGGVLDPSFYGWAAAPPDYVQATWGQAGFQIIEWVPSGVLFQQAMVGLRKNV